MIVETNHERGDEVEFMSEIGKGTKGLNARNHARHTEQVSDFGKHRDVIHIEAKPLVSEQLRDVQKIPDTATKIEDVLRPRQIEFNFANAANVDVDPSVEVEIFRPIFARIFDSVAPANLLEPVGIDCLDHSRRLEAKTVRPKKPERVPSGAGQASAIYKLLKFMGKFFESATKSHWMIDHSMWRNATISTKVQTK